MIRILLVDDQRLFVESLKLVLTTRAEDISVEPVGLTFHGSIFALPPSRSKPPACSFRAAFVRFRRPPWRLFFAIA